MYARMTRVDVDAAKLDQATRIFRDAVDTAEAEEGFLGAYLFEDPSGKSTMMTLWRSEEDMLRTESSGWWQAQMDLFKAVFTSAPIREHYEVAYSRPPREEQATEARVELGEATPAH